MIAGVKTTAIAALQAAMVAAVDTAELIVFVIFSLLRKGVFAVSADVALTVLLFELPIAKSK